MSRVLLLLAVLAGGMLSGPLSADSLRSPAVPAPIADLLPATPKPAQTLSPAAIEQIAACCKTCRKGKACGNSCIARDKQCHRPPGCACDG